MVSDKLPPRFDSIAPLMGADVAGSNSASGAAAVEQRHARGLPTPRAVFVRRLIVVGLVTSLLFLSLAGSSIWHSRRQAEERAEIVTTNLANVLAAHIGGEIEKIDLTVQAVVQEAERQLGLSGGIDPTDFNTFIAFHHGWVPMLDGLRVVNAEGENAYGIGVAPGARTSVADRAYFKRLRDDPEAGLVISEPVIGRVSGKWSIIFARRINAPNGTFAGLAYGTITIKQLLKTFSAVSVGLHGSVAIRDDDLSLIARVPEPGDIANIVGKRNASPELRAAHAANSQGGTYHSNQAFDQIGRIYSYRRVQNRPFCVIVGVAERDYLVAWRNQAMGVAALAAIFILGTAMASWLIYRGWKRNALAILARETADRSLRKLAKVVEQTPTSVLITDVHGTIEYVNPAVIEATGYTPEEILGQNPRIFKSGLMPDETYARMWAELRAGREWRGEVQNRRKDGALFWELAVISPLRDAAGNVTHYVAVKENITARKAMEEELRSAARTDKLTGLSNRALLCDRLQQALLRAKRLKGYHFAVLYLDFDRFKTINDSLGHEVGDLLLQEIARRLRATVRSGDSVSRHATEHTTARLGGDEFVVLLDALADPDDVLRVADRLLEAFSQPFGVGEHEVYATASIGIVTSQMPARTAEDLLRDADTAMYEAKLAGKGQYVVFDVSMRKRVQTRLHLENDLRKAMEAGQMFLMYQPIVSLQTGRVETFEALVRWKHPERGLISPAEFIPIAEDTGLIILLGEWVLREACSQFARWRQTMGVQAAPPSISVNVSRNQLALPYLPQKIQEILRQTGMTPQDLHLEVTESAVMKDVATATQMLHAIKQLGVKLDMDDFGTGYSSLACLHQFPFDVLKIDRSFVANIDRGRDFAALVHAVTQLARNLNISVVAEGIETADQAVILQSLDCEFGQGYLFSKPLMADQVPHFVVQAGAFPGLGALEAEQPPVAIKRPA